MSARAKPDAPPATALTAAEIKALDHIDAVRSRPRLQQRTLAAYLLQIAMLGGYLARNHSDHRDEGEELHQPLSGLQSSLFRAAS